MLPQGTEHYWSRKDTPLILSPSCSASCSCRQVTGQNLPTSSYPPYNAMNKRCLPFLEMYEAVYPYPVRETKPSHIRTCPMRQAWLADQDGRSIGEYFQENFSKRWQSKKIWEFYSNTRICCNTVTSALRWFRPQFWMSSFGVPEEHACSWMRRCQRLWKLGKVL